MHPNRGYCSLCRKHYRSLEQHLLSPQHRHFATYSRNHFSSGTLMERFLHDVRQYHPQRYHDNRPAHDDLPVTHFLPAPRNDASDISDVCVLNDEEEEEEEEAEAETFGPRKEMPTMGVGSVAKSCTISSCRSKSSLTGASALQSSTQMPEKELDPPSGMSQQERRACSGVNTCMPADSVRTTNHMAFITAASLLPHSSPCSPLPQSSPDSPVIAKKAPCSTASPVIPVSKCAHAKMDICNAQTPLDNCPSPVGFSNPPRVLSASHPRSGCIRGSSSELTSGLSFQKHASGKSQGEPLTSDAHLRDISGTVCTCRFTSSVETVKDSQCRSKGVGCRGSCDTSVDDIIEEVILKHCYGILPGTFSFQEEEEDSPLYLKPLLDHSNTEGSDISFNVESPMQLGVSQPKAAMRDLNFLKQTHVTLEDDKYESHLRSVLSRGPVEVTDDVQLVKWTPSEESVLPALPHVPPSFVGKTWSQVMYEDDLKIEALVRDFREGRFHCHFDSDSLTNGEEKRSPRIKKPKVEGSEPVTGSWPESVSAKALPVFSDDISEAPGSVNPSVAYDTLCKPSTVQKPARRTWRLASRCQTVKVSHGTQTSLINYPVVKRKIVRQQSEPAYNQIKFDWQESERTPDMKTRLCALKLPESYTRILSPVQPKNMVYVLSHPEIKSCRGKPAGISRSTRNHYSTDSKSSVTYKYKQCPIKYYDPLTNRILKMLPSSSIRGRTKRDPCVRQLFRSLSLDVNMTKPDDGQKESTASKKSFSSSSSAPLSAGKDAKPIVKAAGPSNSTEMSAYLALGKYGESCRNPSISPLNAKLTPLEDNLRLAPLESTAGKASASSTKSRLLEKEHPKAAKSGKGGARRESRWSKNGSGATSVTRGLCKIRGKVAMAKASPRTKKQPRERVRKKPPSAAKCSGSPAQGGQTRSVEKRPHQEKPKLDKLRTVRNLRKMPLRSSVVSSISASRTTTSKSVEKSETASSKVKTCAVNACKVLPRTGRRTTSRPTLAH